MSVRVASLPNPFPAQLGRFDIAARITVTLSWTQTQAGPGTAPRSSQSEAEAINPGPLHGSEQIVLQGRCVLDQPAGSRATHVIFSGHTAVTFSGHTGMTFSRQDETPIQSPGLPVFFYKLDQLRNTVTAAANAQLLLRKKSA